VKGIDAMKKIVITVLVACACLSGPGWVHAQSPPDTLRLSVKEAVRYALREGVEAAMARQDVHAADARVGVALSYALPHIEFAGTYTRTLKKPVFFIEFGGETQSFEVGQDNAWFATLTLSQTLFASGRVSSGYNMAKRRAEGAALVGDDQAAVIARVVKTVYYQALLTGEQVEIAKKSLDQAERNVQLISARVSQGVTPEFDKLRAQTTVANRRPLVTRTQNARTIALDRVKRAIGIPLEQTLVLTDSLEFVPFAKSQEEMVQRALSARRDLAAARKEAEAMEFQHKAQRANNRPILTLDGNLSWQGETSNGLWPNDNESANSAGVGLSLVWPFMNGFRTSNEAKATGAMAEKAKLHVKQVADFIDLEVRSNWNDVESTSQEITGAEQAVDVARKAYNIAQVRYDKGLSTIVELLDSELALIEAALNLSETLYRYNEALARLEYSVGEGPKLFANGDR
jgi:outer membrane protein TolC